MSEAVISRLSQEDVDVERLARDLAQEFVTDRPQLLVELAKIICSLCKIPPFPQCLIESGNVTVVNAFLQKSLKNSDVNTRNSINDLRDMKAWPNVPTFFRHLIYHEWNFLTGATKFNTFFNEFLNGLTSAELPTLRFFGTAIQFEFTTVCTQDKIELLQNEHRPAILNYTKSILRNSFQDYERKIWAYSLSQVRVWFRSHALLLDDDLLRFLVWGLTDRSASNSQLCLQICLELLDEHHEQKAALTSFIRSLVRKLTPGLVTENMNFFENLCELAVVLNNKYEDIGRVQKFVDLVLQFTFAPERVKAKAAADVFTRIKLRNFSTVDQLRCIVQYLAPLNSILVQLFVDAMIDDYQPLIEWETLADVLKELTDNSEKVTLLLVVVCVVASMLNDETVPLRKEKPQIQPADDLKASMTRAFAPFLVTLSEENAPSQWKSLFVKLAMYFDLNVVPMRLLGEIVLHCRAIISGLFAENFDVVQTSAVLDLGMNVLRRFEPVGYDNIVSLLTSEYEQKLVELKKQLRDYSLEDSASLRNSIIIFRTCRSSILLDEEYMFDIPKKLLEIESAPDHTLLSCGHEVAIMLSSDYVEKLLSPANSSASEKGPDIAQLERIRVVFSVIGECLNIQFYTRVGELAFFALCRLVKKLFSANVSKSQLDLIFTEVIRRSLCTYVALALRTTQSPQLSDFELSTYSMENIISEFTDLIVSDILPLSYAYELLHAHCCQTTKVEDVLLQFFRKVVHHRFSEEVAEWIFHYFAEYFKMADQKLLDDLVERAERLSRLLQPIRVSVQEVMKKVHTLGIDLAVSRSTTSGSLSSMRFLYILVTFSPCLGIEAKKTCFDHFKLKQIVGNLSMTKFYFDSLRVRKKRSVIEDTTSTSTEDPDEPEARRFRSSNEDFQHSESESESSVSSLGLPLEELSD